MTFLGLKFLPWLTGALVIGFTAFLWSTHIRRISINRLTGNHPSSLRTSASPLRRRLRTLASFACLTLLAITILRPIGGTIITENRLPAKNVILMIDVSKSMGVADSEGLTRLEAAKLFAREFIDQRPADRIGLVSFDGLAFPECPTTLSRTMLLDRLGLQTPGGLPVQGSDLKTALETAAKLLTAEPPPGSSIILLSDGDRLTDAPENEIQPIIDRNVPLFAVYFGNSAAESPIPDSQLRSRSNPETMRKLAELTGAIALNGSTSSLDQSLAELGSRIDTMKIDKDSEFAADLQSRPLELYAYPLGIALAFLMIRLFLPARVHGKWHPLTCILILANLTFSQNSSAQEEESPTPEIFPPFISALANAKEQKRPLLVLFTGSDWSESSIKFETEILAHETYQQWANRSVVPLVVDLPRIGLDASNRKQRRELASRFGVTSFPAAVFLDSAENELGRLGHDPEGPASWVRRAELILIGERGASSSETSAEQLPDSVRNSLEAPGLTPIERSIRYYNQALSYQRLDPELAKTSSDRFKLLNDLLSTAASLAPPDRPDLLATISSLRGSLHHERGRSFLPPKMDSLAAISEFTSGTPPQIDANLALRTFRDALAHYRDTARFDTRSDDLSSNLGLLLQDMKRAEDLIAFQEAYKKAVETTYKALNQETQFRENLDRWVTTALPINDDDITASRDSIARLLELAELVNAPMLDDIRSAAEDIELSPNPHDVRHLHPSTDHIQNAYDHLVSEQQSSSSQGDDGNPFNRPQPDQQDPSDDGDGDQEQEPRGGSGDQDLRRSQNGSGDLRDRQLEQLGRGARGNGNANVKPGEDH